MNDDVEHDLRGPIHPASWRKSTSRLTERERMYAAESFQRGVPVVLWTPVVGVREPQSLAEWDALVAMTRRPRG